MNLKKLVMWGVPVIIIIAGLAYWIGNYRTHGVAPPPGTTAAEGLDTECPSSTGAKTWAVGVMKPASSSSPTLTVYSAVVCGLDSVEWYNSDGNLPNYTVTINGTPYPATNGVTNSVPMSNPGQGSYALVKYSIACTGCTPLDPHIIIMGQQ
jgi:hypothetical protein